MSEDEAQSSVHLPRVVIKFCVQCKWNLRAAYYAQELLQTFSTTLGEVSLVPTTGGIFTITLSHLNTTTTTTTSPDTSEASPSVTTTQIWDRKTDGGFPETKDLKNRVRNVVDPARDMGHIDRSLKKKAGEQGQGSEQEQVGKQGHGAHVVGGVEGCVECQQAAAAAETETDGGVTVEERSREEERARER